MYFRDRLSGLEEACHNPTRLPDLPEELLQHVLKQLVPTVRPPLDSSRQGEYFKDGRAKVDTLLTCMRASQLLYRLAHPLLYHTFDTRIYPRQAAWKYTVLLIQKPELAVLAREIHVDMTGDYRTAVAASTAREASVGSSLHTLLENAEHMPDLSESLRRRLFHAIFGSYIVAERALLWALCPNVKILSFTVADRQVGPISSEPNRYDRIPFELIAEAVQLATACEGDPCSSGAMLSRVEEVFVESQPRTDEAHPFAPLYSVPVLQLPSLQCYCGWLSNWAIRVLASDSDPSSLLELHIDTWELGADGIAAITRHFPQLKVMDIRWSENFSASDDDIDNSINPLQFGDATVSLVERARQLKTLRLNTSDFITEHRLHTQRLTSLAALGELRNLEVPIEALLPNSGNEAESDSDEEPVPSESGDGDEGDDSATSEMAVCLTEMLPTSLRTLKIIDDWGERDDAERLDEQLRVLMTDGEFQRLRSIRVRRTIRFDDDLVPEGWKLGGNRYWVVLKRTCR